MSLTPEAKAALCRQTSPAVTVTIVMQRHSYLPGQHAILLTERQPRGWPSVAAQTQEVTRLTMGNSRGKYSLVFDLVRVCPLSLRTVGIG
jgi:hypothetical protein